MKYILTLRKRAVVSFVIALCFVLRGFVVGLDICSAQALSEEVPVKAVIKDDVVTVTGVAESKLKRTNITFLVMKPGKSVSDITSLSAESSICACNQIKAGIGGKYSFKFNTDCGFGEYKIYINEETPNGELSKNAKILSVYKYAEPTAEIKSDKMGHIYFNGDNVDFELNVSATPNMVSDIEVSSRIVWLDMNENGENVDGETVVQYSQSKQTSYDGKADFIIDISDAVEMKYGIFKITCDISDKSSNKTTSVSTRFSRVNARRNRENMNYRMGVAQHLQNGWDNNGFYGAGLPINQGIPGGKDADKFYDLFADAGYNLQREELHWHIFDKGRVEKNSNGEWENAYKGYSFRSDQKQYFDQMKEKGLKPLVILGLENTKYFTTDDNGEYIRPYNNNLYFEAYEKYCYEAVRATIEYTDSYEIMNEYNIGFNRFLKKDSDDQWVYNDIDYKEYVLLMKAAYEGAHRAAAEVNKKITVYGIASAQICNWYDDQGMYTFEDGTKSKFRGNKTYEWINGVLKNGGAQYMDELSFHVYTSYYKPESPSGDKAALVDDLKKLLELNNCGNVPLFISETGYSTNHASSSKLLNTEVQQAKYELRDWARVYNKVSGVTWYNAIEKPQADDYEHSLGHIKMHSSYEFIDSETGEKKEWVSDIPYEAKRVYLAMANWNTLLANSDLKSENVNGKRYDYVFETPDGRCVHMLWNSDDVSDTIHVKANSNSAVLYDMYGNASEVLPINGEYEIDISGEPVYLEESKAKVEFLNSNGKTIQKIGADDSFVGVNVSIDTIQSGVDNALVIVAAYDSDGQLIDTSVKANAVSETMEIPVGTADSICVYVWKNYSNAPIISARTIKRWF